MLICDAFSGKKSLTYTAGETLALYMDFKKVPFFVQIKDKIFQWLPFMDEKRMRKLHKVYATAKAHAAEKQDLTDLTKEIKKIKTFMRKFLSRE